MQIIVKLTTNCNLECVYCSEGLSSMQTLDISIFKKLINELPELLNKYGQKEITILWHGGEPLTVGPKYLSEAMEYAINNLGQDYIVKFLLQTNGTLIDDEWIDIFRKYSVWLGISLVGYQELHEAKRKTITGAPTFELVIDNIEKLRRNNINVATLMVLNTKENVDIDKLWAFIKKYNLPTKIHPVIACGKAEENKEIMQIYVNYIELLKNLYKRSVNDDEVIIEPLNEIMNAILGLAPMRECSYNGSCGINFVCLYSDGAVGFCGRKIENREDFIYGNLSDKSILELYESTFADRIRERQEFLKNNSCKNCDYWEMCHGGCSFEALNTFGTLKAKYPNCQTRKELLYFLQTEGLALLKERLLKEKSICREKIAIKQNLLKELKNEE